MLAAASRGALRTARKSLTDLAAELPDAAGIGGVSDGLFAVVRLLDGSGQLRRALGDPTTPREAKESLLDSLLGEQLEPLAMRVLKQAVVERWSSPRDLVDAVEVLAVQAAFLVAEADGTLDDVEDELFRFSRVVARDPQLRAVLTDRGLDNERKSALLTGLLGDRARPETLRLVTSLVSAPRGRTLEDGLAEYARLAAEIRERSVARVTSAVRLTDAQEERLAAALARTLGRQVQLQVDVDPAVLGGVVVRIGDEVIDGTTRHHLRAARVALTRQ
ncbi:MAG: F-type H+-transporting ATPase subunit delta [Actinomycetota bacterium]|jgi:F-type H+-transporting ATPase subunit delta|nr:F-type H+-transporting ATPase subunit delta [Actinomycetota bacterium]